MVALIEELQRCVGRRVAGVAVYEEKFHGFEVVFEDGSVLRVRISGTWSAEFMENGSTHNSI